MNGNDMKKCPYCAEMIKKEAIKCRYCGSNLSERGINFDFLTTPGYWHRVDKGKKIAGVCTGLAHQFDAPVLIMPLRLFFILTTIFYGFGIILYILLWLLMSPPSDSDDRQTFTQHSGTMNSAPSGNPNSKQQNQTECSDDNGFEFEEPDTPVSSEPENDLSPADNGEQDSAENKTTAERIGMKKPLLGMLILSSAIVILFKISLTTLKSFWVFELPPFTGFAWIILAIFLLWTAGGLIYKQKHRTPIMEQY